MTIAVRMRGDLDAKEIPGTFEEFVNMANIASAKGLEYIVMEKDDGLPIAFKQGNILTIEGLGDDSVGMID